ncbi:hypothetical protein V1511DRAFT_281431 [Dipodascopsis uninucleata]
MTPSGGLVVPPQLSGNTSTTDCAQRYRRGHRRNDISSVSMIPATQVVSPPSPRTVNAQMAVPRSWSTSSLPLQSPSDGNYSASTHYQPYSPEHYYQLQRQSQINRNSIIGRAPTPFRAGHSHSPGSYSSITSSSSSESTRSSRRHSMMVDIQPRNTHDRQSSVDSVSTYNSSASQADSSSISSISAESTINRQVESIDKKKSMSRLRRVLSFGSMPTGTTEKTNLSDTSIYDSRNSNKRDDEISIVSTSSTVSKAIRKISASMLKPKKQVKPSSEMIFVSHEPAHAISYLPVENIMNMEDQVVDEMEINEETKKEEERAVKESPRIRRKGILKYPSVNTSFVGPADEPLPGLTREASFLSQSSSSSSTLASMQSQMSISSPISEKSSMCVSFSPHIEVFETWDSSDYDRKITDPVPYNTFPAWMIDQIKDEINAFKRLEMDIHEMSRANTCFY